MIVPLMVTFSITAFGFPKSRIQFYKEGYENGYKKGEIAGEKKGWEEAIRYLKKVYRAKIKEYEAVEMGRILIKDKMITYPTVYQINTPWGARVVVGGCKIMGNINNFMKYVPNIPPDELKILHKQQNQIAQNVSANTNINSVSQQNQRQQPRVRKIPKFVKVEIPEQYKSDLMNSNVAFYKDANKPSYTALFQSEEAAKQFCANIQCKFVK